MAKVIYYPRALTDLDRLEQVSPGARRVIQDVIQHLADHPLLGPVVDYDRDLRRLVISRGKTGYVALYRYQESRDLVRVASIRHQREAGI